MDPISLGLTAVSGILSAFGGASQRNAEYVAQANATRERNNQLVKNYNRSLMTIALQNYGKLSQKQGEIIDYNIAVDNNFSAAARAFAKNEVQVQAALDKFKLDSQSDFVGLRGGLKANEGGRTSAANINALRASGRAAGSRLAMMDKVKEQQFAVNKELADEVNQRLNRAHDRVFKQVRYNELMPEKPTMLSGPAKPSQLQLFADLAGVAGQAYLGAKAGQKPKSFKEQQPDSVGDLNAGSSLYGQDLGLDYDRYRV